MWSLALDIGIDCMRSVRHILISRQIETRSGCKNVPENPMEYEMVRRTSCSEFNDDSWLPPLEQQHGLTGLFALLLLLSVG